MPRLIDADALKELIANHVYPVTDAFNSRDYGMFWTGGIEKAIDDAPTVDAEPVRHGRWIYTGFMEVKCSECSETFHELESTNYCPNCGAKMDEDGKDD